MAKTKISEFDVDPSNNTDINSINIAEGCAPSGINNAIRQLMSDLKEQQTGASGDNFTVGGNFSVTGTATFATAPVITAGGGIIPTGGIIIWSGAANAIPSGWLLCNGSSGTPDLRNRFIVGAGSTYAVGATGGSADAIVVSHTHTASTNTTGAHTHNFNQSSAASSQLFTTDNYLARGSGGSNDNAIAAPTTDRQNTVSIASAGNHSHTVTIDSAGSSGTNANLPPYYALCYIMKA
jgi:microcystin-dependent protein